MCIDYYAFIDEWRGRVILILFRSRFSILILLTRIDLTVLETLYWDLNHTPKVYIVRKYSLFFNKGIRVPLNQPTQPSFPWNPIFRPEQLIIPYSSNIQS